MNKKCVICYRKNILEKYERDEITDEELSQIQKKIRWAITSSSHRIRLVCGPDCYDELLEFYREYKEDNRPKRCERRNCLHSEKMHTGIGGSCMASMCRCYGFTTEEEQSRKKGRSTESEDERNYRVELQAEVDKTVAEGNWTPNTVDEIVAKLKTKQGTQK